MMTSLCVCVQMEAELQQILLQVSNLQRRRSVRRSKSHVIVNELITIKLILNTSLPAGSKPHTGS